MSNKHSENFDQAAQRILKKIEAPVLSPEQARILDSGYIDSPAKALDLLEKADQYKEAVLNCKLPPGARDVTRK